MFALKAGRLIFGLEFGLHAQDKVLGPTCRADDPVSHGFLELFGAGPGLLRDREVFLQSVRAARGDSHRGADQFPGFDVKHFGVGVVGKNLCAGFHVDAPPVESMITDTIFIAGLIHPALLVEVECFREMMFGG